MKEAVITSSILILCIAILRKFCRGRIRASIQYALWLLVAIRLMIPGIIRIFPNLLPESDFSILNLTDRIETAAEDYIPQPELPIQVTFPLSGLPVLGGQSADGPTSVFLAGKIGWQWRDIFHNIWFLGVVVVGVWMLVVNIRFGRKLRKSRTHYEQKNYKLPVYLVKDISSPCLYGVPGRQAVYLPEELAKDSEKKKHILTHERCHYKHGDVIWSALRCVLVTIYWFHPLVWVAAVLSKQDCELACDESAIRMLGEEERIAYGKTLVSLITRRTKASDIACTATTMTAGAKSIRERVQRIAAKPRRLVMVLLVVLAVTVIAVAFTFTKAKKYPEGAYVLEEENSLTVTTGCFQITFPESFSGKACYQNLDDTNLAVYHRESGQEIGRFCAMSYEEAKKLSDEQEVIRIGDYGSNPALKRYMEDTVTEHEYHSYFAPEERDETTYVINDSTENAGVAGTDSNSGVGYIPAPEETEYHVEELPFVENNTYLPEEESVTYLPNEEIVITSIPSKMPCYLYVPADYEETDAVILGELEAMNRELSGLVDSVRVFLMSVESVEAVLDTLTANRNSYVGDNTKTAGMAQALPVAEGLSYQRIEMQTTTEPYAVTLCYNMLTDDPAQIDTEIFFVDAALLFASIENLGQCSFRMIDREDTVAPEEESYEEITYEREDFEKLFGKLYPYSETKENLTELYNKVLEYLEEGN